MMHLHKIQLEPTKTSKPVEFAGVATTHANSIKFFEYQGFMAILNNLDRELITTVDWANNAVPSNTNTILTTTVIVPLNHLGHKPIVSIDEKPFYLDSGTTVHILPYATNFVTLQPIPPHPVDAYTPLISKLDSQNMLSPPRTQSALTPGTGNWVTQTTKSSQL
ncbi:hypothetical protein C0995_002336 [Termitomyces sp. Mi166|nr:hypothetical protein C0995_002336 [Termitomyces sp. Mi166\